MQITMFEDPALPAREAKRLQQGLKELLKTHEPWDRDVDIQRKNLRRQYLRLLFVHPYATESNDAVTHLWMQTSYGLISMYKQHISTLDRTIHGSPRQQQQQQQQQSRSHGGNVVEYRKLLQRFRQFLSDEQKFWVELIVRIRRRLPTSDPSRSTVRLDMIPDDDAAPLAPPNGDVPPRRNNFQFPSDADIASASSAPLTPAQRESWLGILSKALVCLGDIERYKEQYNEAGGRPRAGYEDGPPANVQTPRGGRNRRGTAVAPLPMPRMRNYEKALKCYEQARLLQPQDGNPSHQLAIIAAYQKDNFGALVQYYRALCVAAPYDTAADNLSSMLNKALEQWNTRGSRRDKEREKEEARSGASAMAPRLRVEAFKERLIVLHALWQETESASVLGQKVVDNFMALVSERVLPIDLIMRVVTVAQGALWKHRTFRLSSVGANGRSRSAGPQLLVTESQIATHVMALHRTLLTVGIHELKEAPQEDDLAQRITATFRRTLPALRIASKWLRANLSYVLQSCDPSTRPENGETVQRNGHVSRTESYFFIEDLARFWATYAEFANALLSNFPVEKLPAFDVTLEEDVEVAAFLPLKRIMSGHISSNNDGEAAGSAQGSTSATSSRTQAHPNEEQLMRIADLLADAQALTDIKDALLTKSGSTFMVDGTSKSLESRYIAAPTGPESLPQSPSMEFNLPTRGDDDDNTTETSHDDPVRDAFMKALGENDDSEGFDDDKEVDEIVWHLRSPRRPDLSSSMTLSDSSRQGFDSPQSPIFTPRGPGPTSPRHHSKTDPDIVGNVSPGSVPTTAGDLLKNVLGIQRSAINSESLRHHSRGLSVPQTQLPFGSNQLNGISGISGINGTTPSIWSTVHGGTSPQLTHSIPGATKQFHQSLEEPVLPDTRPPRKSLLSYQPQASRDFVRHTRTSSNAMQPTFQGLNNSHQRVYSQSEMVERSQVAASHNRLHSYDPFGSISPSRIQASTNMHDLGMSLPYTDPPVSMSNLGGFASTAHFRDQQDYSMSYSTTGTVQDPSSVYQVLQSLSQPWGSLG